MNNLKSIFLFTFILTLIVSFSSCKKDNPILEDDQEEFHNAEVVFTNLSDPDDKLTISFDQKGIAEKSHYHLLAGNQYKMEIAIFHDGKNINQEFIDDIQEHKFFFIALETAVTNYVYKDNDLGLNGEITFGDLDTSFDFQIILRHGLNKNHSSAKDWNSKDYRNAGGVDDLVLKMPMHLVSSEEDHD